MNKETLTQIVEDVISEIDDIDFYVEATLQFEILKKLWQSFPNHKIYPEVNKLRFGIKEDIGKKEIDIALVNLDSKEKIAIELKMPLKGQVPEQMFSFCKDIAFLEGLRKNGFEKCYFVAVTNNDGFRKGKKEGRNNDIYKYFRYNQETLTGEIRKPTGDKEKQFPINISSEYNISWKDIGSKKMFYTILEVVLPL